MKNKIFWVLGGVASVFLLTGSVHAADANAGKSVYDQHCAKCHGATGKGDGNVAVKMKMKMADYSDKQAMAKLTDEFMMDMTKKGGKAMNKSPKMPSYDGKLSDDDMKNVVAYIRTFAK